jgi:metal-responsive CopG/Arc/MetJ family transcriptional regulator
MAQDIEELKIKRINVSIREDLLQALENKLKREFPFSTRNQFVNEAIESWLNKHFTLNIKISEWEKSVEELVNLRENIEEMDNDKIKDLEDVIGTKVQYGVQEYVDILKIEMEKMQNDLLEKIEKRLKSS